MSGKLNSRPTLSGFSPDVIPYQRAVMDLVRDFDYSKGTPEILLSGSYGSAKSTLLAHMAVVHCLAFPRARVCVARRSTPDLKRTIWAEVLEHIAEDMTEGTHYELNRSDLIITFKNGSQIITAAWADGLYTRFRSLKLSMLVLEEVVENNEDDFTAFKELKARLRRLPHVRQNILIAATNPDSPGHWVWRYFVQPNLNGLRHPTRFVYYSLTEMNPFLDPVYVEQLKRDLSPREAERYLMGRWIEIAGEVIYYAYDSEVQFLKTKRYEVDPRYPVGLTFDFNIGLNKPMSAVLFQYRDDVFHFFSEVVVQGARTADIMEELDSRDLLRKDWNYFLTGDAAGRHRDTRSTRSDYDIITVELQKRSLNYVYGVPLSNPALRLRHNRVNAYCRNAAGDVRLFVYGDAPTADEALRLTKFKKGAGVVENDAPSYQHIGTALGYGIISTLNRHSSSKTSGTRQL